VQNNLESEIKRPGSPNKHGGSKLVAAEDTRGEHSRTRLSGAATQSLPCTHIHTYYLQAPPVPKTSALAQRQGQNRDPAQCG
jgi:hypothetical protein